MQKTPSQQALMQFIESMLITALIAGIVSISSIVTGSGPINWSEVGVNFGLAIAFSLAHSLSTYLKSAPSQAGQPDLAGLGAAIDALTSVVQQRAQSLSSAQPAQNATQSTIAQPVRVSANTAVQPSTDGVQQPIAAFTATAEQPAVKAQ